MLDTFTREYIDDRVKSADEPFTAEQFWNKFCEAKNIWKFPSTCSKADFIDYVKSHPLLIAVPGKNLYITRQLFFHGAFFSIKLSVLEKEKKLLFIGDRFLPFVNEDYPFYGYELVYNDDLLPLVRTTIDKNQIAPFYALYGREYFEEALINDTPYSEEDQKAEREANENNPDQVTVQTVDLTRLFDAGYFDNNDRIYLRVMSWYNAYFEICPNPEKAKNKKLKINKIDIKRQQWFKDVETKFASLLPLMGPSDSIAEQLYKLCRIYLRPVCAEYCGSLSEMIQNSSVIGIEQFGVETRIWFKNQEVPAVGEWTRNRQFPLYFDHMLDHVPSYVMHCYGYDMVREKSEDYEGVMRRIFPSFVVLTKKEEEDFLLLLKKTHDIIKAQYNPFADYTVGELRHDVLQLFEKVNAIVIDIEYHNMDVSTFPSREIIMLCQLYSHMEGLLLSLDEDEAEILKVKDNISDSLEGMETVFEAVSPAIEQAIQKARGKDFTIIK